MAHARLPRRGSIATFGEAAVWLRSNPVLFALAFPACVIDDMDLSESLRTSWEIAPGNLLKLFGITLFAFLISFGFGLVALLGGGIDLGSVLIAVILTTVIYPIVQLSYARVYLENRPTRDESTTIARS